MADIRKAMAFAVVLGCAGASGCQEQSPGGEVTVEPVTSAASESPVASTLSAPEALPPADGCIRGGTPRGEVRALLGEPDSISWGVWLYGRSEITFGYGVVVAFADPDDRLYLCSPDP